MAAVQPAVSTAPLESIVRRTVIERGVREKFAETDLPNGMVNANGPSKPMGAMKTMMSQCEDDKRELQELNTKFATYLGRVRYLEGQNKKLEEDLDGVRAKWGFESGRVRDQFDSDLIALRRQIDEATKDKALMELRMKRAMYDCDMIKRQIDFDNDSVLSDQQKLSGLSQLRDSLTNEITLLESKYRDLVDDLNRYRAEMERLIEQMEQVKNDLDSESLARVQLQNDLQTLEDQLSFLRAVHEDEINELKALCVPSIDTSQFYRAELTKAISDIRRDFDQLNRAQQIEMEEYYKVKTEEIKEQVTEEYRKYQELRQLNGGDRHEVTSNLRSDIAQSRQELGELQKERIDLESRLREIEDMYDRLRSEQMREDSEKEAEIYRVKAEISDREQALSTAMESNVSLRFEINTYRRLLEGEEIRLAGGIHNGSMDSDWKSSMKAERISVHKSARGPIFIDEIDPSGSFILLANTSANREQDMRGWCLRRKIDQQPEIVFYFSSIIGSNGSNNQPGQIIVRPRTNLRVYSRLGSSRIRDYSGPFVVADHVASWSLGSSTVTKLIGEDGQEKAVYYQRIGDA
ncbi:hypothetical protein ACOME3_006945 [Neoechinorhynchus agilis]